MNMANLKIGARLAAGFGALALIVVLLGSLVIFGLDALSDSMKNIADNRIPALQVLAQLNRERMVIRAQTLGVYAYETRADVASGVRRIQQERLVSWERVDRAWEALRKIPRTSEKGRLMQQQLEEEYKAWRKIYVELDDLIAQLASVADMGRKQELYTGYRQTVARMVPISDAMGKTFDGMTDNNMANTNRYIESDRALSARLKVWAITATALGIAFAALLGWFVTRSVTGPLQRGSAILEVLAEGDMSHEVPVDLVARKDEVGDLARAMRGMTTNLKDIVSNVTHSTTQVSSAAAEIAQGSSDLAQRTEEQASALEETASSMEELTCPRGAARPVDRCQGDRFRRRRPDGIAHASVRRAAAGGRGARPAIAAGRRGCGLPRSGGKTGARGRQDRKSCGSP